MDIKMYDVNWGEAILYDDGHGKILVDCGSKFYPKGDMAYNAVKNDFSFGKDALLITHFDEDHYNGVISMVDAGKRLNRVFLPKYLFLKKDGKLRYTDSYFASIIYFHLLGKKRKLDSLHRLIISLIRTANNIKSVAHGDCIHFGSTRFNIIWPKEDALLPFDSLAAELRAICVEALRDSPNSIERLNENVNEYTNVFVDFYRAIEMEMDGNNIEMLYEGVLSRLNDAYENLLSYEDEVDLIINDENSKVVNSKLSSFIRSQNDCSVVFCKGEEVLALGDVSNKVVKHLIGDGRIADYYKYMKASHHGTVAYYSPLLPKAKYVFISNNGTARRNWKISDEYARKYKDKCYCTNTDRVRCEWLLNGNPYCKACNMSGSTPTNPRCLTV